jgi:hypothetical protein
MSGSAFNPSTSDFSIGCAFYMDALTNVGTIFSAGTWHGSTTDFFWVYVGTTGAINVEFNDSSGAEITRATPAGTVVVGTWNTLVVNCDRDGNLSVILNNGTPVTTSIATKGSSLDPGSLSIGRYDKGAANYFKGRIDNAFYANRILTANEITYLHNNGKWRQYAELGLAGTDGANLTPTYGVNLISNGTFDSATTDWTLGNSATLASVAGGESGNALQVTNGGVTLGYGYQAITTVAGATYQVRFWHKNGTTTGYVNVGTTEAGSQLALTGEISDATGSVRTLTFVAEGTTTYISVFAKATTGTTLFDGITVKKVDNIIGFYEFDDATALGTDATGNSITLTNNGTVTQGKGVNYLAGVVSRWEDRSGSGRHLTQATLSKRPAFITNVLNGKPGILFDGVDDFLSMLTGLNIFQNVSGATMFAVIKTGTLSTSSQILIQASNGLVAENVRAALVVAGSSTPKAIRVAGRRLDSDSSVTVEDSTGLSDNTGYVATGILDYANSNAYVYRNGTLGGSSTSFQTDGNTSNTASIGAAIGANPLGASPLISSYILEIVIYNRALSAGERSRIEKYLGRKYSTSIS